MPDYKKTPKKSTRRTAHRHSSSYDARAIAAARRLWAAPSNDELEIDENPKLSHGEDGTWVAAWVFVHKEEIHK